MKGLSGKSYWLGFASGFVFTALLIVFLGMEFTYYGKVTENDLRTTRENLPRLEFPTKSELVSLGRVGNDWKLRDANGRQVTLSDYRGKVVFLDFWATWCGACTAELPSIDSLRSRVAGLPVQFVYISSEERSRVDKYVRKHPFIGDNLTSEQRPPMVLSATTLPTTFILDREGNIVFRVDGYGKWDDTAAENFLRELASGSSSNH